MKTVGRNDPCPCGSGKKYKKCCLKEGAETPSDRDRVKRTTAEAFKCMSEKKWDEAIDKFKSIQPHTEDPFSVLWALAACHDGREDFLRATEYFEKALKVCPPRLRMDVTYQLGVARGCAGRIEKAEQAFRDCVEMKPPAKVRESLMRLLDLVSKIRRGEESVDFFRFFVQLQRAFSDMEADKFDSAATRLEELHRTDPEDPVVTYNLAVAYTFLKKEQDAMDLFEKTVTLSPDYVEAWFNMGQIALIDLNDYPKAIHCFDRAIAMRPDYMSAHHQRGVAFEMMGDYDGAIVCWKKALEIDPEYGPSADSIERLESRRAGESDQGEGKDSTT